MKNLIFVIIVFAGLIVAGCSTTTYFNLKETNLLYIGMPIDNANKVKNLGAEVSIQLKSGNEVTGELLSIQDSTMTICTEYSATEEELANLKYPITTVRKDEIQKITIEGSNYVWIGTAAGVVGGFGVGYALGHAFASPGQYEGLFVAMIVWAAGIIAGPIIGYALSSEEYILQEIPPEYDLSIMKSLARYPDEEPEYLKAIP